MEADIVRLRNFTSTDQRMNTAYTIATLNINGIRAHHRMLMLADFLRAQDVDLLCAQEVTTDALQGIPTYTTHLNMGTEGRGTALLVKDAYKVDDVRRLPSGRGIMATFNGIRIVNIYAPSGTSKRKERELFYNLELPHLIGQPPAEMLIAGDFNCVLQPQDSTGVPHTSRALHALVDGLDLTDTGCLARGARQYTHYTPTGASRLDRIYVSRTVLSRSPRTETRAVAFSDHMAVVIHTTCAVEVAAQGRGVWRMNAALLNSNATQSRLAEEWTRWDALKRLYSTRVQWLCRGIKPRIRTFFKREGRARAMEAKEMSEFLYTAIYDLLSSRMDPLEKHGRLQSLKAQLRRLHTTSRGCATMDAGTEDKYGDEEPSLYHLIRATKRRNQRSIHTIKTPEGEILSTTPAILRHFRTHFTSKYGTITTARVSKRWILQHVTKRIPEAANEAFECEVTLGELFLAVKTGKRAKAPGPDGIVQEFYQQGWDIIHRDLLVVLNDMYLNNATERSQKHGLLVCLPKTGLAETVEEYRPLTLLNADFKILARIIVQRMRPWTQELLSPSQHCGLSGLTIFDALATVRDVVAYADVYQRPICILSLDFKGAFEAVSHEFLAEVLLHYGYGAGMVTRIMNLYDGATSSIRLNGFLSAPLPILASVRQGCPLSMMLYAHVLDPLLCALNSRLQGIRLGGRAHPAAIAYADDVTIFLTSPTEIPILTELITVYEQATGAQINPGKSKLLGLGTWDPRTPIMDFQYCDSLRLLGTTIAPTTKLSGELSWKRATAAVKAKASRDYARCLSFDKRVSFIHEQLYAHIWFLAQTFPPPAGKLRELQMTSSRFLWEGEIFRLPLSTICRPKRAGGWDLVHVAAKCRSLFHLRTSHCRSRPMAFTNTWMAEWCIGETDVNPPTPR
jgi:exonuclease III